MPTKLRYRHDDDAISVEGRGKKRNVHASLRKRDGGSSRSSRSHSRSGSRSHKSKHGSHRSKYYYSESDTSSLSSEGTIVDTPGSYDTSDTESSSSIDTRASSKSGSTGIVTMIRGKRGNSDKSKRSHKVHESDRSFTHSATTWRPNRHGRGGAGIREAAGLAAALYGAFQHTRDRIRGTPTSKLHHALFQFGIFEGVHRRNVRVKKGDRKGIRGDYEEKSHSRRSHRH
jgi:hypothetical protein